MRIYKYIYATIATLAALSASYAQTGSNAIKILDRSAAAIKKCGNIKATFTAAQFKNKQKQTSENGTVYVSGKKYYYDLKNAQIWYDGKTQWTYSATTQEVNISSPTKAEAAKMNPYSFIYLYKQGYNASVTEDVVRGKKCYDVHLVNKASKSIKYIYLTIDKETMLPLCIRVSANNSDWTRISIYDISKKQKFGSDKFLFNPKEFPNAEIIDLR